MRGLSLTLLAIVFTFQAAAAPYHPAGVNVTRWAKGEIEYRDTASGAVTGGEAWDLTVHPDGSRTVQASNHLGEVAHTVTLHVAKDFRPLDAYVAYWREGRFRDGALFAVRGDTLEITAAFADRTVHETIAVPEHFSLIPHPLASDVWHGWYFDKAEGGVQTMTVYDLDTGARGSQAVGKLYDQKLQYLGREDVTVPAGTFPCDHFRVDGVVDYYVTGPDAIFVKFVWTSAKATYVLTSLTRSK